MEDTELHHAGEIRERYVPVKIFVNILDQQAALSAGEPAVGGRLAESYVSIVA